MRPVKSSTPAEAGARAGHLLIALILLCVSGYLAFLQTPANPIAALVIAAISAVPIWISLYAQRKLVFQSLLMGYWF
jgi:disulfide bond formation protein DsbB